MKKITYTLFLFSFLISSFGCKTYLSDEIRNFIPYDVNQELTFVSDKNVINIFKIIRIQYKIFTGGIGASKGEGIEVNTSRVIDSVSVKKNISILYAKAQYGKKEEYIRFELNLTGGEMSIDVPLSEIKNKKIITFKNRFNEYKDVLKFEFVYNPYPRESQITELYWSLSNGYVRVIQHDGIIWDLKSNNTY